jgi:hypothetical protein
MTADVATKLGLLLMFAGCSAPARQAPPAPPPQAEYLEVGVTVDEPDGPPGAQEPASADSIAPPPATSAAMVKHQPPHLKLKLGHFRNARLNIGVTIDLTEQTENVADIDPAQLRFDGDTRVWRLQGQHGPYDRIDYAGGGGVMLHAHAHGGMSLHLRDPDTGRPSDEIPLYRDGDADPL